MKFQVSMKCPDALDRAISENIDPNDEDQNPEQIKDICDKWFECGECVTLEIDTDAGTCIVLEA